MTTRKSGPAKREHHTWHLGNDSLSIAVDTRRLTIFVTERVTGTEWGADPWKATLGMLELRGRDGRFTTMDLSSARVKELEETADSRDRQWKGVRMKLIDFPSPDGPVRPDRDVSGVEVELALLIHESEPEFKFVVEAVETHSAYWDFESLQSPVRLFPLRTVIDDGYLAFCYEHGTIIPTRFSEGHFRYFNWIWERIAGRSYRTDRFSMPWFGAKKEASSFICILETPDDVALDVIANDIRAPDGGLSFSPRITAASPLWRSSRGSLRYPRTASYRFFPNGTYVDMAKHYRSLVKRTGLYRSLQEKTKENPEVQKLIGAPYFEIVSVSNRPRIPDMQGYSSAVYDGYHHLHTTFSEIAEILRDMHDDLSIKRALALIAGWGQRGYDNWRPIDTLPFNAEAGGEEKLKEAVHASKELGFLVGLFDNYRNLDLESPSYRQDVIGVDRDGSLQPGFSSEGGPSHQICSIKQNELCTVNMETFQRICPNVHFFDTTASNPARECYSEDHPLTRTQDKEWKRKLLTVAGQRGLVVGCEGVQDWVIPEIAFYQVHSTHIGLDVPLFNLVYHDAVIMHWQHSTPYNYGLDNYGYVRGNFLNKVLIDLLYGNPPSWVITRRLYSAWKDLIRSTYDLVAEHHARIALEELQDHRVLTSDFLVQESSFSGGTKVVVNFGPEVYLYEEKIQVPARGFRLMYPDNTITGSVEIKLSFSAQR
jgi:hypothetical protein